MLYRIRKFQRSLHNMVCRGIVDTPPVQVKPAPLTFCSMCSTRDFVMYLAAMKSIYKYMREGRVVTINDGSLTQEQQDLLRRHLNAEVRHIDEAPKRRVPKGGTWERLTTIVELSRESYVIQVDADTLTRSAIPEILETYRQSRPFILAGDRKGSQIISVKTASKAARASGHPHIQTAAESKLDTIPGIKPFYVRGCSGFFGIPQGALTLDDVEEFSESMTRALGERWKEWGTEQMTVNYLVSNLPGVNVLQPPKYTQYFGTPLPGDSSFVHFIGSYRFDGMAYTRETRKLISELRAAA
jgi:hypothetical protein